MLSGLEQTPASAPDDGGAVPAAPTLARDDWMMAPPVRPVTDLPADPREEAGQVEKFKVRQLAQRSTWGAVTHDC